ncbi:hypothetical protein V5799_014377 [Amblyomma americanum]|uniref:Uncharacterized protein n=1 Tax=Amblyomma americanum TaxID=6943 RepID=A0AAQ4E376_AMBAM
MFQSRSCNITRRNLCRFFCSTRRLLPACGESVMSQRAPRAKESQRRNGAWCLRLSLTRAFSAIACFFKDSFVMCSL